MKPKSIRGAIQMMLPEVEEMLSMGVARSEVFNVISERFGLDNVNVRSFDTALYRARKNRMKHTLSESVIHITDSGGPSEHQEKIALHNTQEMNKDDKKKHQPGIIGKAFFDEVKATFNPDQFFKKY